MDRCSFRYTSHPAAAPNEKFGSTRPLLKFTVLREKKVLINAALVEFHRQAASVISTDRKHVRFEDWKRARARRVFR